MKKKRQRKLSTAHLSRVVRTMEQRGAPQRRWDVDESDYRAAKAELQRRESSR